MACGERSCLGLLEEGWGGTEFAQQPRNENKSMTPCAERGAARPTPVRCSMSDFIPPQQSTLDPHDKFDTKLTIPVATLSKGEHEEQCFHGGRRKGRAVEIFISSTSSQDSSPVPSRRTIA